MEKFESKTNDETHILNGELSNLFKALSNPDALKIFLHTDDGIEHSKYAIAELDLTPKRYYSRLKELVDIGLVRKVDDVYRQTALGRMVYDRFLPAMGKAVDAREELELIVYLEGTEMESGVRKQILNGLDIPSFEESTKIKLLRDYEALAIEAIDLYDSAEESVLLASNYIDVRVMEACFRSVDRGITNRLIIDKKRLASKMQRLKMMLSLTFAKTIINFASTSVNLSEFVRFIDLPYTFCVVDGNHTLIEMSDALNESFIVALSFNDRVIGEKFTEFFETLWKAGDTNVAINILESIKSN